MKPFSHLVILLATAIAVSAGVAAAKSPNKTFTNPVLPGWHSDPSCIHNEDGIFLCVTSTFIAFPGLPVYASRDLLNWKLVSHAWSRESQLPGISQQSWRQMGGMYAATIRLHVGVYYVICEYLDAPSGILGVIFKSKDPFSDEAWSDPVLVWSFERIDPDLFWDDDGKVYAATHGIVLQEIDLQTGGLSQPPISLWNGTGGVWPEGPHIYKKDGWYYLLIAEGGTELDHAVMMARSRNITGPYEASAHNPHLTNRGTGEFFQTVGHADLFQDSEGNWWGMSLATRSGPQYRHYPMGREAVLFPVTWEEGGWPVMRPIRGRMEGPLPTIDNPRELRGDGPFVTDPDNIDFIALTQMSKIPRNLIHWRVPRTETFSTTAGKGLKMVPTRSNLTGVAGTDVELNGQNGLAFIGRRQTHTQFAFSVDLDFAPRLEGDEAGVTVFLTQYNHIDLGLILLRPSPPSPAAVGQRQNNDDRRPPLVQALRLRVTSEGTGVDPPPMVVRRIPDAWAGRIRLQIRAVNLTHYELSAAPASTAAGLPAATPLVLGSVSSRLVSGGEGPFVGTLLGAYATCNGAGTGDECPGGGDVYLSRWLYTPEGQHISETEVVSGAIGGPRGTKKKKRKEEDSFSVSPGEMPNFHRMN